VDAKDTSELKGLCRPGRETWGLLNNHLFTGAEEDSLERSKNRQSRLEGEKVDDLAKNRLRQVGRRVRMLLHQIQVSNGIKRGVYLRLRGGLRSSSISRRDWRRGLAE